MAETKPLKEGHLWQIVWTMITLMKGFSRITPPKSGREVPWKCTMSETETFLLKKQLRSTNLHQHIITQRLCHMYIYHNYIYIIYHYI